MVVVLEGMILNSHYSSCSVTIRASLMSANFSQSKQFEKEPESLRRIPRSFNKLILKRTFHPISSNEQNTTAQHTSHLILCCPLFLMPPIPPSIRVFSNESTLRMRWPK